MRSDFAGIFASKFLVPFGASAGFQLPKRASSSGSRSASVVAPTAKISALSGRIQL
jgi:hypothetical protein